MCGVCKRADCTDCNASSASHHDCVVRGMQLCSGGFRYHLSRQRFLKFSRKGHFGHGQRLFPLERNKHCTLMFNCRGYATSTVNDWHHISMLMFIMCAGSLCKNSQKNDTLLLTTETLSEDSVGQKFEPQNFVIFILNCHLLMVKAKEEGSRQTHPP